MRLDVKVESRMDDRKVLEGAKKALAELMLFMEETAVVHCPTKTGQLKNAINLQQLDEYTWTLSAAKNYAAHVEYGTRPHLITVKNKKALHWKDKGNSVFATRVWHPGTQASPYFRPALDATKARVPLVLSKHL